MRPVAALAVALHACFLVLEMFLWTAPAERRVFGTDADGWLTAG